MRTDTLNGEPRKFTDHEAALVEEVLQHDGFELLMRRSLQKRNRLTRSLCRPSTDWDETTRIRGEIQGLAYFTPDQIRSYYPKSEKP